MVTIKNPVIWADVPDNDVIRVDNAFYMVSTSMHSMPGCPIMRSYDLQNWEVVSYVFDRISDKDASNLENGENIYGKGSWAASLRKIGDWFYCLFNCNDDHCAYMFRTRNIEESNWEKHRMSRYLHDPSILVDDDKCYVLYGNHDIYIAELTADLLDVKEDDPGRVLFTTESENIGLTAEGCHAYKIAGIYYAIFIEWPVDGHGRRREVCYRWKNFDGPFENRIILDDDMGYHNQGVAQGAIFTLPCSGAVGLKSSLGEYTLASGPDGNVWGAVLFQDHGAVGRIPYVLPVNWQDGWPMPGIGGAVPETFELPIEPEVEQSELDARGNVLLAGMQQEMSPAPERTGYGLSVSDDFKRARGMEEALADTKYMWQWNHNPDNTAWSLSERKGYLRLMNQHLSDMGVLQARNTLTQRTFGPKCECVTHLELGGLRSGDCAGLAAIQGQFGIVGVRAVDDEHYDVVMCVNDGKYGEKLVTAEELPEGRTDIYLKIKFDFEDSHDTAVFYRSLDGRRWKQMGKPLALKYTLDHFMGYRIGLYSYATEKVGGFADFEYLKWN